MKPINPYYYEFYELFECVECRQELKVKSYTPSISIVIICPKCKTKQIARLELPEAHYVKSIEEGE